MSVGLKLAGVWNQSESAKRSNKLCQLQGGGFYKNRTNERHGRQVSKNKPAKTESLVMSSLLESAVREAGGMPGLDTASPWANAVTAAPTNALDWLVIDPVEVLGECTIRL
jgi:hypothetical protein